MAIAPHYLRFARAVALVSMSLPVPAAAGCIAGCTLFNSSDDVGVVAGPEGPVPGVVAPPSMDAGINIAPERDASPDASDASDAENPDAYVDAGSLGDGGGGGGPSRGIPELPASFLT